MSGRVIAIGDIHGCAAALHAVLDTIAPAPDDWIVPLGDLVNRGPDSRGVIEALIALQKRCRVTPILGNHDEMFVRFWELNAVPSAWLAMGGGATLDSYGIGRLFSLVPVSHIDFVRSFASSIETSHHLLLHAQYEPNLPLEQTSGETLRWASLRERVPGPHRSGKRAIVGHTSQKNGEILDRGHIVCIDTFCSGGGWLTALDINTCQVWQADRNGRMRARPSRVNPWP
jgi:serine/threonine protein phosphatase 1